MNPQLLQAIMEMLAQGQGQGSQGAQQPGSPTSGLNQPFGDGLNLPSQFSPVNRNPNYASTVGRFFDTSALAGGNPFQPRQSPMQPGLSGSHASRASGYWPSIGRQDHNATMMGVMNALRR